MVLNFAQTTRPFVRQAVAVAATVLLMTVASGAIAATAADEDVDAHGKALVDEFIGILKQEDAEKAALLQDFLADEFQLVRSNGVVYDKEGYVANPASVVEVQISDVHATEANGVLVVSYVLTVDEVLDGVTTQTVAPRLSVFHRGDDGAWRLSAHANFGAIDPS